jgi:hypothetical protein
MLGGPARLRSSKLASVGELERRGLEAGEEESVGARNWRRTGFWLLKVGRPKRKLIGLWPDRGGCRTWSGRWAIRPPRAATGRAVSRIRRLLRRCVLESTTDRLPDLDQEPPPSLDVTDAKPRSGCAVRFATRLPFCGAGFSAATVGDGPPHRRRHPAGHRPPPHHTDDDGQPDIVERDDMPGSGGSVPDGRPHGIRGIRPSQPCALPASSTATSWQRLAASRRGPGGDVSGFVPTDRKDRLL